MIKSTMDHVPKTVYKSIRNLVNYTYAEEQRHFLETPVKDNKSHIFRDIKRIDLWLQSNKK